MGQNSYDSDDWNSYHRKYRSKGRAERLAEAIPKDKRCPVCDRLIRGSQSWVLAPRGKKFRSQRRRDEFHAAIARWTKYKLPSILCRSCFQRITSDKTIVRSHGTAQYVWNGELLSYRLKGIGIRKLSRVSGFSYSYIRKLGLSMSFVLNRYNTTILAQSLVSMGVRVKDLIRFSVADDTESLDFDDWMKSRTTKRAIIIDDDSFRS